MSHVSLFMHGPSATNFPADPFLAPEFYHMPRARAMVPYPLVPSPPYLYFTTVFAVPTLSRTHPGAPPFLTLATLAYT